MRFNKTSLKSPLVAVLACAVAVVLLWAIWWHAAPGWSNKNYSKAAAHGELFGSLNALFTGLAFVGLTYNIVLQRTQLRDARAESAEARATGAHQRFENTFFQMLNLLNGIIDSMTATAGRTSQPQYKEGRDALYVMAEKLVSHLRQADKNFAAIRTQQEREDFLGVEYDKWYEPYSIHIAHYFRVLYRILQLVDDSAISDKIFYAKVVRAQLSAQETVILFYNCFSEEGKKMRHYVERYALLKHFPEASCAVPSDYMIYPPEAYGE